ncbi:MAG: hypothetical protein HZA74_10320 [Ignavibacteriales bacterium]|jgi:hypothetical protein|nr:hypothetical protein [Ignavibacteriales bacterium]
METKIVNHRDLYRLPWTLPDNAISWLEPTAMCNLACDNDILCGLADWKNKNNLEPF